MTRMIERSCIICGDNLQIVLDKDERVVSGGYFFKMCGGDVKPDWEYWECLNCYEEVDE